MYPDALRINTPVYSVESATKLKKQLCEGKSFYGAQQTRDA